MTQQMESVLTIVNGQLVAVVWKDMKTRRNVFYRCEEMTIGDIENLLKAYSEGKVYEIKK